MRALGDNFFIIALILITVIAAGCSSFPFSGPHHNITPEKINAGFSSATIAPVHETYNFERVTKRLADVVFDEDNNIPANATTDLQILYIRGMRMDRSGNADNWLFAIRHRSNTSLVTYDRHGETITRWNASFRAQEIPMDRIISPGELFNRSHAIIFRTQNETNPNPMELEIQATNYTLTISGRDRIQILEFDATTGALVGSNV